MPLALVFGLAANHAQAAGVRAGETISNTAQVSYSVGATTATTSSNTVSVVVAEVINVDVTIQTATVLVTPGATQRVLRYRVENTGNGPETFRLVANSTIASGDDFDPVLSSPAIYLDDGDGVLGGSDTPYVPGSNDPALDEDTFVIVLVANNIPAAATDGQSGFSSLTAESRTGVNTPGFVYDNAGFNNTDAVIGTSGGDDLAQGAYTVEAVAITAAKTQSVTNQFNGPAPIPGARIVYSVAVNAVGSGTAGNAEFIDDIPANTTYEPGSLTLNSVAISDAADADAGVYETTPQPRVRVQLGDLTQASGTQTVQFAVIIN